MFYFYNINKFSTMPRVFIIASHGSMPMIDNDSFVLPSCPASKLTAKKKSGTASAVPSVGAVGAVGVGAVGVGAVDFVGTKIKKPASFTAPVDTFTTAKCGHPFCADLRCDEPFVGLAQTLSQFHLPPDVPKNAVRQLIQNAMTGIRSDPRHADALTRDENKIRCHKKGHLITDLFLFDPTHALPIIESVTMVDMQTGEIQDVHGGFGLVEKQSVSSTREAVDHSADYSAADRMAVLHAAKQRAEYDLQTLQHADPFYFKTKQAHIKTIDDTMNDLLNESKFEYSPELKKRHGTRVKLSDLLKIGTDNGLINPVTDFVVVYACRVPDERVPAGAMHSPRGSDSEGSVGGTGTRTRSKKCNRHNRHRHSHNRHGRGHSHNRHRHRSKTCKQLM